MRILREPPELVRVREVLPVARRLSEASVRRAIADARAGRAYDVLDAGAAGLAPGMTRGLSVTRSGEQVQTFRNPRSTPLHP